MKTAATTLLFCVFCSVLTWNLAKLPERKEERQWDAERLSTARRISGIAYLYETGELGLARMVVANQLSIFHSEARIKNTRDEIGRGVVGFYKEIELDMPSSFISRYPLPDNATERDFESIKEWVLRYPKIKGVKSYSESEENQKYEAPNTAAQTTASPSSGL